MNPVMQDEDLLPMQRSELEMNVDILKALARHGPLKLTHIMYKANVNCSILKQHLDFLVQHNLVEEQTLHNRRHRTRVVYAITEKGKMVLKCFKEVTVALKIVEEANKIPALLY
ncbi:MAG: ArsR family transcriptional regulator [Candidatus Bathyarchaeota archaeon]|nr:MAG: ArsR family transcriptional regulator [Candidatus Bathyarchaeota archaeon]